MAYSLDFRKQVLRQQKSEGLTNKEVSKRFGISPRTLFRWKQRLTPKGSRNKPATKIDMAKLQADIKTYPDAYQYERAARLGVSKSCVFYALKRLSITYKKTLFHPKLDEKRRAQFRSTIQKNEAENRTIIYVDESGFELDMPRTHGYADKGKRCYSSKDYQNKSRVNAIGAIVNFSFVSICLFDCYVDSDVFVAWLTQDLLPKVKSGAVIVWDNASFHKRKDILQAIEQKGLILECLPTYSPDLNPIEHKWAQAKAYRKKHNCDIDQIFKIQNM